MESIYLDYNGFQRGFDNPRHIRIQIEALACQEIFVRAESRQIQLIWSFMHQDETLQCPFPERKYAALRLAILCTIRIGPEDEVYRLAKSFQAEKNISSKDAIHLACASFANADFFLTCDDKLLKQAGQLNLSMSILNPVDYIRRVM